MVSTGKIGTGYLRLNANPNDQATPYMDIVERTGSGVYDVELKARLGDLSGLSSARLAEVSAPSSPGFGLYTDNVFLKGAITATTGSIGGVKMQSSKLFVGTGTHDNTNTGFYLDSSGNFSLGDKLVWDGTNLAVEGSITLTSGEGFVSPADVSASMAEASSSAITTSAGSLATVSASLAGRQAAYETQVVLDSGGMDIQTTGGVSLADYGSTVRIGKSGEGRVEITDNAIAIYDGQSTPCKWIDRNTRWKSSCTIRSNYHNRKFN